MINCEYFNNLNENGNMAGTSIMTGICTSPYPSPYPTEKVGDSPYPYPYPVNAGILVKTGTGSDNTHGDNGDGFGQYPRGQVYLPSLHTFHLCMVFNYCTPLISRCILPISNLSFNLYFQTTLTDQIILK